jgi:translation elongation factor EF-G
MGLPEDIQTVMSETSNVRNVCVVGHVGNGMISLTSVVTMCQRIILLIYFISHVSC